MENVLYNHVRDFILIFTSILYEALPFIILGSLIAGFLEELVPQQMVARVIPRNRGLAIGLSGVLGLVFPMCECGIIPVMRRLLRKGLPLSCCVAYMLAGPIINVVVMGSTYVAFSLHDVAVMGGSGGLPWMLGLRVGLGYLVAVGTALIVERQYRKYGAANLLAPLALPPSLAGLPKGKELDLARANEENGDEDQAVPKRASLGQRLGNISATALHDFVDITVFLILGALLAAFVRQMLTQEDIAQLSGTFPLLAILAMMGMAVVLCLCSEADAFVAASFITMQPAAKLAFLVLGPMLDFKLYMMYTRVFRPRLIWTIIPAVVVQVLLYTLLVHYLWAAFGPAATPSASGSP